MAVARPLPVTGGFARELEKASGVKLVACFQCQKCSSGCPVAAGADIRPHEVIRLAQLGARDELLSSRLIWECTSCGTCEARCPQGVALPAVIDALRRLSREARRMTPDTTLPVFNDVFLALVRQTGRVYEVGLMAAFKLRTRRFGEDMGKLPMMLRKGKLALRPPFVRGRGERQRIFRRARGKEGSKR
ncbi:MAG: 4Fe-4S dicluster domain-containing protein [Dehalococcoidia bacterium]